MTEARHKADMSSKPLDASLLLHSQGNRTNLLPARPAAMKVESHGCRIAFEEQYG
jgi:hypothetical protein